MVSRCRHSWVAVAASCVLHTGFVATAMLVGGPIGRVAPDVLELELVDPAQATPAAPPPPERADRTPPPRRPAPAPRSAAVTLPRPIETPVPQIDEARAPDVPPPAVREPEPPPAPPEPGRVERAPEPPASTVVAPGVPGAPAAGVTSTETPHGDGAPGGITWPAPPTTTSASERTGVGATGSAGAAASTSVARGTGDVVTSTAYPRGGYQVRPSYPVTARRLGIQGTSLLRVFVAADGRVGDVVVQESAGHPDLDQAAATAVRRWRFEPARRGAEAVAMWVLLPVEFHLK